MMCLGGGAGMVMTSTNHSALESIDPEHKSLRIYMSPQGEKLNHNLAKSLSNEKWITLINGSFEGVDQRVIDLDIDKEISIGDYILTSGDFASLVIINSISRFIPGVLGSELSGRRKFRQWVIRVSTIHSSAEFFRNRGSCGASKRKSLGDKKMEICSK